MCNVRKVLPLILAASILLLGLTACGSGSDSDQAQPSATLPAPGVRVETLPSATPEPLLPTSTPEPGVTIEPTFQVQAWPTMTDEQYEQYLLDLVEGTLNDIENRLNNTDTNIKP